MFDVAQITPQHAIYIPMVALLGIIVGYIAGSRAVRADYERRKRRMKE